MRSQGDVSEASSPAVSPKTQAAAPSPSCKQNTDSLNAERKPTLPAISDLMYTQRSINLPPGSSLTEVVTLPHNCQAKSYRSLSLPTASLSPQGQMFSRRASLPIHAMSNYSMLQPPPVVYQNYYVQHPVEMTARLQHDRQPIIYHSGMLLQEPHQKLPYYAQYEERVHQVRRQQEQLLQERYMFPPGSSSVRASKEQLKVLHEVYAENPMPSGMMHQIIGERIGMSKKSVRNWFQNMRAKERRTSKVEVPQTDDVHQLQDNSVEAGGNCDVMRVAALI